MSAINLVCVSDLLVIELLRVFLVSEEVDVLPVLLWDALNLWVRASEYMLPPLIVVKRDQLNPSIEVLIFTLDDALLPFLVMADVIIGIEAVVPVMLGLFIPMGSEICLQSA